MSKRDICDFIIMILFTAWTIIVSVQVTNCEKKLTYVQNYSNGVSLGLARLTKRVNALDHKE